MDEIVFICNRCGDGFSLEEADRRYNDDQPETVCPSCGSYDLEEAKRCKVCRNIVPTYELRAGCCKGCFNDAVSAWKDMISNLQPWVKGVLEYEFGDLDITEI